MSSLATEYDLLCEALPAPIVQAAELCALPHFVDDQVAYQILHDFANLNGTARRTWAEVKRLPFVYPYEQGRWRFIDAARIHFSSRLEQNNGMYLSLHQYLVEKLEEQRRQVEDVSAPEARELEWRIAYHLAPFHPERAVERLIAFGESAAQAHQLADVRGVIDLFEEQKRWLSGFRIERAYFEGRYAYALQNYPIAEDRFAFVWEHGRPDLMKAISGHLLGRILESRGGRSRQEEAERLYGESLRLLRSIGDRRGVAMVLNSLGGVLVALGGRSRQQEAERLYRESLRIGRELGLQRNVAMVLNSLGVVLVALGGHSRQEEAEGFYRESLRIGRELGLQRHVAMVLNSLGGVLVALGGRSRQQEAEDLYHGSLKLLRSIGDRRGVAMVLNSLGGLLVALGGRSRQQEAERLYRESLKIERSIGNRRGEAMVLFRLSRLAEELREFAQAHQYLENVISIEAELGNLRHMEQNRRRLEELRRKLGG
ncbi:MAG TPA: tetratricopeptide repeat protein [Thermoanaerobaculia bacterium]|nr:tetratricopeptide repeat protein [Thermoanaerobaculia bacterium]